MFRRISALFVLAIALIRTLLLRSRTRGQALSRFAEQYGSEGLLGVDARERVALERAGRCIACGRCDAGQASRIASSAGRYRGLMHFALSGVRSMPDYAIVVDQIEGIDDETLRAAELICPTQVPFVELAALVRHHAKRSEPRSAIAAG